MKVGGLAVFGIIDSAAQISVLSSRVAKNLQISTSKMEVVRLRNAQEDSFMEGRVLRNATITLGGKAYKWTIFIADIADQFLLGLDFLRAHKANLDLANDILSIGGQDVEAVVLRDLAGNVYKVSRVTVK